MSSAAPMSPGRRLRDQMNHGIVTLPGVFNAISARAATAEGAEALYLSGAGVANALLAKPDIALVTLTEAAQQAAYVCAITDCPVLADADTGFGESLNVERTVQEMERAGLAGIHLEDQVSPKRCGHLDGKSVVSTREMVAKLNAALATRRDPDFLIVARTDARGVEGLDAAILRANAYRDTGADAIFPEGLHSEDEFARFRDAVDGPLLANMTEFGKTPLISVKRFEALGYNLVIFPMTAFRVMLRAISDVYRDLVQTGTQAQWLDAMKTRHELYALIDYPGYEQRDREWAKIQEGESA
ncbi:MAG: methylisocitrate lyase [Fimbriimonadaceae bacterium]